MDPRRSGAGDECGRHAQCAILSGDGQPNATVYAERDPASLVTGLFALGGGVTSCDFKLSATPATGDMSTVDVTLDGMPLINGTDWTLDADGITLHVLGSACTSLRSANPPVLDATFACSVLR
jgi:hypothetical protein